jgi:aspartyl/asparaginyl-tRNA synthetase
MSKPVSIKDLEDGKLINKPVHVFGWVKTFRSNRFISLNDGTNTTKNRTAINEPLEQTHGGS